MPANNKVALVTGSARRVGAQLITALHNNNFSVLIHYCRSHQAAATLCDELNRRRAQSATLIQGDLNSIEDVGRIAEQVSQQHNQLDVLINNASTFFPTPLGTTEEHHWDDLFNSNVKAPFFLCQKLVPLLEKAKGCIINISDVFAERPMPNHTIYSMAKAANNMLTKSLALELAPKVRVNAIAPGAILWPEDEHGEEVVNLAKLSQIPMGRLGGSSAIVDAALYLIHHAEYTTGQIIGVDGGRSLKQ